MDCNTWPRPRRLDRLHFITFSGAQIAAHGGSLDLLDGKSAEKSPLASYSSYIRIWRGHMSTRVKAYGRLMLASLSRDTMTRILML